MMDPVVGILMGIGLSAACGFRVFLPLLVLSIFSFSGLLSPSPGFSWIGTYPALITFITATLVEIAAYFIPGLDHLLDMIATPAAVIAGTLATASLVTEMSPFLKWTFSLIAGGGAAAIIQGGTVLLRAKSGLATGGMGNPLVATGELIGSAVFSLLAVILPVITAIGIITLCIYLMVKFGRAVFRKLSKA
jgi:hypothetical protein